MSDEQLVTIDESFFEGLSSSQKDTFERLLQQNSFLRESIVSVEESATDRVATLNAELEDADNTIDKLESQIAALRVEVSRLQVQNDDLLEVVETATESAKMSMMREAQVHRDAEDMIKEKVDSLDAKVSQAEFAIEQKYTTLLYEIQDEKESAEARLREVEAELTSTLVIVEHKTEANASLTKQVEQLEETKTELEMEIKDMKKQLNSDVLAGLRNELKQSQERNAEFKDAVARIKWRSKEEIDVANDKVEELQQSLAAMEKEQQALSAELVRVMEERDSLEAELEDFRLNYQQKRSSGDISDLESLSGASLEGPPSPAALSIKTPRSLPVTHSYKYVPSPNPKPRAAASDRSTAFSVDDGCDNHSQAPATVPFEEHKAKLAEKHAALDDTKRKHFILMEEVENLRKQHTELMENNMLERKNREKLLKAAQKELATVKKEYKHCQKHAAAVEKELSEYLQYHKRQTEIKDATISVHKELAKSRAANADLAKQLVESNKAESATQQLNKDLQDEVNLLLAEVASLQHDLDARASRSRKWADESESEDDDDDDDDDDDALFSNDFRQSPSPRLSNGARKQSRRSSSNGKPLLAKTSSSSSSSDYDALKQMYLATALDSLDRQRREARGSSSSSVSSGDSRASSKTKLQPKLRPRQTNTNLNNHYSPAKSDHFSN